MKTIKELKERYIKFEIPNALSHGLGVILGVIFLLMLIIPKIREGDTLGVVAFSIYGGSFILLFLASTIYHAVPFPKAKAILRVVDHISIYYFIAGSYTPAILLLTEGKFRIVFIILIWALALLGTFYKIFSYNKYDKTKIISLITYIGMGWLAIFLIKPIIQNAGLPLFLMLVAGGLIYTVGTFFYKSKKLKYNHLIWHFFVLAAAVVHFNGFYFFL